MTAYVDIASIICAYEYHNAALWTWASQKF